MASLGGGDGRLQALGAVAALVVLTTGVLVPSPSGVDTAVQRVFAILGFTILLWLARPVPYAVSSVLGVSLLFALGVVDSFEAAVSGYASTLVFFLFVLMLLGGAVSTVGLDERIANRLLAARAAPRRTLRSLSGSLLATAFFMPSGAARVVTFIPIVRRIVDAYGLERGGGFDRSAFLVLGHINPIASMALMTGGGLSIVGSELIRAAGRPVTWVEWAVLMIPPTVAIYALSALTAERLYDIEEGDATAGEPSMATEPLTRDQMVVAGVMVATIIAWIVGSFVGVPAIIPAVVAVAVLALPGVGVVDSDDVRGVSWGIIFLIGAMFSILDAMEASGALELIVDVMAKLVPFGALPPTATVATLLAMAVVLRALFSSGPGALIVALPIVLAFGEAFGVNTLYLGLSTTLLIGSTTVVPFNNAIVLIAYNAGPLSNREVFGFGMVTMAFAAIVSAAAWLLYWPIVT